MSQMTATARPLRAPRRGPAPTPLRVIPSSITRTGTGTFATTCIGLLIGGLIALLLLNTALAQGSLALGDLQRESVRLSDTAGNLQEEIDRASATGMVRMNTRGYVDLSKGTVTGEPEPATKNNAFPIVTSPTPPAVTASVKKVLSSASKVGAAASAASGATPTASGASTAAPAAPTLGTTPGASTGQATDGAASDQGGQAQQTTVR